MKKDFRGEIWLNVNENIFEAMREVNSEPVDGGYGKDSHSLKAEELKCKIAAMQTDKEGEQSAENLTKILVDFVNDKQNYSKNTENLCASDETETPL